MPNEKAAERTQVAMEFGILMQAVVELANRDTPPKAQEWRIAIAQVQSGVQEWMEATRKFATFGPDLIYESEHRTLRRAPSQLCNALSQSLARFVSTDAGTLQQALRAGVEQCQSTVLSTLQHIPVEWQPEIFQANTPFTAYMRIKDTLTTAYQRFEYFDRYLKPDLFDLFVRHLPRSIAITLVSTAGKAGSNAYGVAAVSSVSLLASQEFASYRLVQVDPISFMIATCALTIKFFPSAPVSIARDLH